MKVELSGHYSIGRLAITSVPMIAMMLITSIYSIIDGYFISNFAGSTAFAAMNLVWPLLGVISALGLMVGTGGSALISKTLGEGDPARAGRIMTTLRKVCVWGGVLVTAVVLVFLKPILLALGSDSEMLGPALVYGRIVLLAMPMFIVQMAFQSMYMAAERPQLGTILSIACGVINVVFDYIFIVLCGWGLTGAAVATAMGLAFGGIFPLWFFGSKTNRTHLRFEAVESIDWAWVGKSCTNGLSEFVGNIALNIVGIAYNYQLMKYIGQNGVSAYGIIMYIGFVFSAVFIGYNISTSQIISYNYGASNKPELRSLFRKSIILVLVAGIAMTLAAEYAAPGLGAIFVGYDRELLDLTVHAVRVYMFSFLICGVNMFCSAWFTALNNGTVSAVAAFARTLVFELGMVIIIPAIAGIDGIWYAVSVAETLALILSISLFWAYSNRYLRPFDRLSPSASSGTGDRLGPSTGSGTGDKLSPSTSSGTGDKLRDRGQDGKDGRG